jgi:hypothetical protein
MRDLDGDGHKISVRIRRYLWEKEERVINETMCWREAVRQMDAQQKSSKTGMNRNTGVDLR